MTTDEFRASLTDLDMGQAAFARFLDLDARTVRRWSTGDSDVPRSIVLLLMLMQRYGLKAADL